MHRHRTLQQQPPSGHPHPAAPGANVPVLRRDRLGGLIHEYSQVAWGDTISGTYRSFRVPVALSPDVGGRTEAPDGGCGPPRHPADLPMRAERAARTPAGEWQAPAIRVGARLAAGRVPPGGVVPGNSPLSAGFTLRSGPGKLEARASSEGIDIGLESCPANLGRRSPDPPSFDKPAPTGS